MVDWTRFNWILSATTYDPYGNVIIQAGDNNDHGFTGEFQDSYIKLGK